MNVDVIFLQVDNEYDGIGNFEYEGVTWSQDKINDGDAKYLLATPEREVASELFEACQEIDIRLIQLETLDPTLTAEIDDELSEQIIKMRAAIALTTEEK